VLAGEEQLAAGFGGGDRRGGHQLRDLADGVTAQAVVVKVIAHSSGFFRE
jgi:hypothetical protein